MQIPSVFKLLKRGSQHAISFLNGAVGDSLKNTPLDISLCFYEEDNCVTLDKSLPVNYFKSNQKHQENKPKKIFYPKICILIHGLVNNEHIWNFSDDAGNYGSFLEKDLNYTPFYVRYNTGLHISDNGKEFSALLQSLCVNYPIEISEITIVAHSMGGLVTHSACHYALANENSAHNWTEKVKNIFLLGTPHLGSFLEKFANVTTSVLAKVPNWHTRLVGKVLNWRSEGIKDLRFGYLAEENWKDQNTDDFLANNRTEIKTLQNANYHVISGQLGKDDKSWLTVLFGDILVHEESAFAGNVADKKAPFNIRSQHTFGNTNHFALTSSQKVYDKIAEWLA